MKQILIEVNFNQQLFNLIMFSTISEDKFSIPNLFLAIRLRSKLSLNENKKVNTVSEPLLAENMDSQNCLSNS